jgi:glycosyltransferase involved in cell wall biosynthesis
MYMANLVRALAAFGNPGIETILFVGPERAEDGQVKSLEGLPRTRIIVDPAFSEDRVRRGVGRTLFTGRNQRLLAAFGREGVDVAFTPALYLGWRSEIPAIAWFPDFQHRHLPHLFSRRAWWKRELGFRAQIKSSVAVMLSSRDSERDCLHFYPEAAGCTHVVPFAVPVTGWPDLSESRRLIAAAGLPYDYAFLPNQLWRHKNHAVAIEAASLLAKRGVDRPIITTGHAGDPRSPNYRAELDALITARGAPRHFRFLGSVDYRLVQALVQCANALVNPSRFEGWSTTVEEAKTVGTPLILSDLNVHREQAPNATFFRPDDAVALADAIAAAPRRTDVEIQAALTSASQAGCHSQAQYAEKLSRLIMASAGRIEPLR